MNTLLLFSCGVKDAKRKIDKKKPEGKGVKKYGEWVGELNKFEYKEEGISLNEICDRTGKSKPTVTALLNQLTDPERVLVGKSFENYYRHKDLKTIGDWYEDGKIYLAE